MAASSKYELQGLLAVRVTREETAAKAWALQKEVVEQAESELARRRQQLEEYKQWRRTREDELFEEVMHHEIHTRDLEDLRFRIQRLRDEQAKIESQAIEAKERLTEEEQKQDEAKQQYFTAYHQRTKLDEHKAAWSAEAAQERERWEEKEVEDVINRSTLLTLIGEEMT